MKKIISILTALVATMMATSNLLAQNSNEYQMTSAPQEGPYKFVIEGTVDLNIPDSCYNIYFTDIDGKLSDNDLAGCVQVKDKKFRYETSIEVMKQGRIRALLPGNKLHPAWINIYFIPGFTVYMTIHNGYFDIHNEEQYKFMVSAWQNEVPVTALLARIGMGDGSSTQTNAATQMKVALNAYDELIKGLKEQLRTINNTPMNYDMSTKEKQQILNRIEQINAKMETLVDNYVKETSK